MDHFFESPVGRNRNGKIECLLKELPEMYRTDFTEIISH